MFDSTRKKKIDLNFNLKLKIVNCNSNKIDIKSYYVNWMSISKYYV